MIRQIRVPFFFRVFHCHFGASEDHVLEMLEGNDKASGNGRQIEPLAPVQVWSWNRDRHLEVEIKNDDGDEEDIDERDFEKEQPAESHQLVPPKSGQGPADPHKKEN